MCVLTGPGPEDHVGEVDGVADEVHDEPQDQIISLQLFKTGPETQGLFSVGSNTVKLGLQTEVGLKLS